MLLALELLLLVELAAGRDGAVLRRDVLGIGTGSAPSRAGLPRPSPRPARAIAAPR